jgi:cell division protein FtsB
MSVKQAELAAQIVHNLSISLGRIDELERQIETMQATIESVTAENVALKAAASHPTAD